MQRHFCNYEISLKLKELGFDEKCDAIYNPIFLIDGCWNTTNSQIESYNPKVVCSAPLWSQALDYFRDTHNMDIIIKPQTGDLGEKNYVSDIWIFGTLSYHKLKREISYSLSREKAILKAIELCKK